MKILYYISIALLLIIVFSCNQNQSTPPINLTVATIEKDSTGLRLDSLKNMCQPGDLVVRLGDDFISDRIRYLSITDHSYSHAGIIVMRNNKKMVCHIYPDDFTTGADTVCYDRIDSFLNVRKNLTCALYRYDLSEDEKMNLNVEFNKYHNKIVRFDKTYDLKTDDKLYCSEMIFKVLKKVTNDRIVIEQSIIPQNMLHLVTVYFGKYKPAKNVISTRKFIAIDNLYNNPHCRLLMKFALKDIP